MSTAGAAEHRVPSYRPVGLPVDMVPVDATAADKRELLELASACEMRGDIGLRIDREPDFFALNRLEGSRWQVGVVPATAPGSVAGCVAVSERHAYIDGRPTRTMYLGDLKVHPAYRGGPVADALEEYARAACRRIGGETVPCLLTILAGNGAMERRTLGPRGLPVLTRFATIRSHSIPFVWSRPGAVNGLRVDVARRSDLEEMARLWRQVAPGRQFAPVHDADSLAELVDTAPALGIESFWLARDRSGRIIGFVAAWDQSSFKQLRVTSYSARLGIVRAGVGLLARMGQATPLPPAGSQLRCLTAFGVCIPGSRPDVLRALLLRIYAAHRTRGYSCLNIGLDLRDPLAPALQGLLAQPTDVHAYITTPAGVYTGPALGNRPLHYETALV